MCGCPEQINQLFHSPSPGPGPDHNLIYMSQPLQHCRTLVERISNDCSQLAESATRTIHLPELRYFISSTSARLRSPSRSRSRSFSSFMLSSRRRRFEEPYGTEPDGSRLLALFGDGAAAGVACEAAGSSVGICAGESPDDGVDGVGEFIVIYEASVSGRRVRRNGEEFAVVDVPKPHLESRDVHMSRIHGQTLAFYGSRMLLLCSKDAVIAEEWMWVGRQSAPGVFQDV
ncbi:hypothetical protein RSAG8_00365, partial [Rhizoctonia solani AG-8 WAC10335]